MKFESHITGDWPAPSREPLEFDRQKAAGLSMCSDRPAGSQEAGWAEMREVEGRVWVGRRDEQALDQSDLLLEGPLCGPGGGVSGGCLDRLVGHDTCGELLLGSLETGTGGSVRRMDLKRKRRWFTTVGNLKEQFRHKYISSHNLLPLWWGWSSLFVVRLPFWTWWATRQPVRWRGRRWGSLWCPLGCWYSGRSALRSTRCRAESH